IVTYPDGNEDPKKLVVRFTTDPNRDSPTNNIQTNPQTAGITLNNPAQGEKARIRLLASSNHTVIQVITSKGTTMQLDVGSSIDYPLALLYAQCVTPDTDSQDLSLLTLESIAGYSINHEQSLITLEEMNQGVTDLSVLKANQPFSWTI